MPNFYNNYSYLAIGYFSNLSAVAAYDIVRRIMNISEQTIGIISKVYYPVLSSNFHRFNKFLKVIFSIALIVFLMQIIFSFIGAMFLANTSLNIDTRLLYIQSFAPLILAFELAYGINFLGVNNQDRLLKNITILSSVIGFILVSVLTFKFAALGALIGVLLTILIKAIISYKMSNKYSIMVNR
jgi:O-antigen/teichoic acid export membrane protein